MASKRKVTVSLDAELAEALEQSGGVSSQLNDAGWALVERRRRTERLTNLLDEMDRREGPLPDDPAEDARLGSLLGGVA